MFLKSYATVAAGAFCLANASPITKRVGALTVDDTQILQYARESRKSPPRRILVENLPFHVVVTAENLEFTFYSEALAKMDAAAFEAAGYPPWVRNRSVNILNVSFTGRHAGEAC